MEPMEIDQNTSINPEELMKILQEQYKNIQTSSNSPDGRKDMIRAIRKLKQLQAGIQDPSVLCRALGSEDILETLAGKLRLLGSVEYCYTCVLVIMVYMDKTESLAIAQNLVQFVMSLKASDPFTISLIAPKCFHYCFMVYEANDCFPLIVPMLQLCYDRALQYSNTDSQATLINLLLRSSILQKRYEQADKMTVMQFPDSASNDECARYLYYIGRIRAIKLDYAEAFDCFQIALRRAPQNRAVGFHQMVNKYLVVVQLLLGDIPERKLFLQDNLCDALTHYYKLTYAVKIGRIDRFEEVVQTYAERFKVEGTLSLISRLHHNVIKTGLRSICAAYSRISVADVSDKLVSDDCRHYVEKAISAKVVDAKLTDQRRILQALTPSDTYKSLEPLNAFNKRIVFCLSLHDQFCRAMRYRNTRVN